MIFHKNYTQILTVSEDGTVCVLDIEQIFACKPFICDKINSSENILDEIRLFVVEPLKM